MKINVDSTVYVDNRFVCVAEIFKSLNAFIHEGMVHCKHSNQDLSPMAEWFVTLQKDNKLAY